MKLYSNKVSKSRSVDTINIKAGGTEKFGDAARLYMVRRYRDYHAKKQMTAAEHMEDTDD